MEIGGAELVNVVHQPTIGEIFKYVLMEVVTVRVDQAGDQAGAENDCELLGPLPVFAAQGGPGSVCKQGRKQIKPEQDKSEHEPAMYIDP